MKYNVGRPFYQNTENLTSTQLKKMNKEINEVYDTFIEYIEHRQDNATFPVSKEEREKQYNRYDELLKIR